MEVKHGCEQAFEKVEKQGGRPFVGAKVFEHMGDYKSHCQGDVEVIKVPSLPEDKTLIKGFTGILAEGLANSGHHIIQEKDLAHIQAFQWEKGGEFDGHMIIADKPWTLTHPNHKWVTSPAGNYQVKFPCEINLGELRKQRD